MNRESEINHTEKSGMNIGKSGKRMPGFSEAWKTGEQDRKDSVAVWIARSG